MEAYIFGGTIFVYGIGLILYYVFKKIKTSYLLVFSLLYTIIGSALIAFSSLIGKYINYFIYFVLLMYLLHAIFKMSFRTLNNNIIRKIDIIIGILYLIVIGFGIYSIIGKDEKIYKIVYMMGVVISSMEVLLAIIREYVYYKEIEQLINEIKIANKATPKDGDGSNYDSRTIKKKKKIKEGKVEVIDLERFFKE